MDFLLGVQLHFTINQNNYSQNVLFLLVGKRRNSNDCDKRADNSVRNALYFFPASISRVDTFRLTCSCQGTDPDGRLIAAEFPLHDDATDCRGDRNYSNTAETHGVECPEHIKRFA